jgi:hypothetical protein
LVLLSRSNRVEILKRGTSSGKVKREKERVAVPRGGRKESGERRERLERD